MKIFTFTDFNKSNVISIVESFRRKIYRVIFFLLLLASIFFGGYIWHQNLYSSTWTADRVQEFVNTQDKGIVFNENNYKKALDIIGRRNQENAKSPSAGSDFFVGY